MQNAKCKSRAGNFAFCVLHAACCALLLVACGPTPRDTAGPVRAAEAFVAALEARDASAIIELIEPSEWRAEIGPELRSYLGLVAELDLSGERYEVVEHQGDTATVQDTGTFAYTFAEGGESGERPVELWVETVRVDGRWYLRGVALPQPGNAN
jgi:hypothetical protein